MKTDWEGRVIRTALVLLASISQGCRVIESRIPGSKVKPTEVAATPRPAPTATATSMPPTPTDRPPDTETPGLTGMYGPFAVVSPVPPEAAVLDVRAAPDGALWWSTDAGLECPSGRIVGSSGGSHKPWCWVSMLPRGRGLPTSRATG